MRLFISFAALALSSPAYAVDPAAYGALPTISDAAISPDGRTVARLQYAKGVNAVAFIDLAGEKAPVGMELKNAKGRWLQWGGPEHVLLLVSDAKTIQQSDGLQTYEIFRWYSIDREAKKFAIPFRGYEGNSYYTGAGDIMSMTPDEPDRIVMAHGYPYSLYDVDLRSGDEKLRKTGEAETADWALNSAGEPVTRIDYYGDREERRFYLRADSESRFKQASAIAEKREDDDAFNSAAPGDAPGNLVGLAKQGGYWALRTLDANSGAFIGEAETAPGHDVDSAIIDPFTGKVVGFSYTDDFRRARYLDGPLAAAQSKVERALPNAAPVITSWSRDYKKFLVNVAYADHPDQIFLFEPEAKSLSMHAPTYAALDGKVAAKKERFDYTSADELTIRGYLTVPAGGAKKNAPLIVLPHGGPFARDNMSFDWWAFFYAANGFLVYQPNFRGSHGYGAAFKEAGYLQWGAKMQDDVSDGVRKLIADGTVDPKRVCIVGGSYGGYAALVGATLTPDLYACAVSVNGVSNLPMMIAYQTDHGAVHEDAWDLRIGGRVKDNEELKRVSPSFQAGKGDVPIMLIHGDDDTVVPIDQSTLMRTALEKAGRQVEFVKLKDEDHWLSHSATRTEMLAKSLDFINRHIGASAPH